MSGGKKSVIAELDERSREVFRQIVDAYVETGDPIGSRTLARRLPVSLSPATIRNVMADLEQAGLLYAPHTSAGRLPTEIGMRLFVDGLMEVGHLSDDERQRIEGQCAARGMDTGQALERATTMLSGLSRCVGMVVAPKTRAPLKHIEFVNIGPGRALAVMITESGIVENRVIEVPPGLPFAALVEAGNYLTSKLRGRTLEEARGDITQDLEQQRAQLDELSKKVIESGLATWAGGGEDGGALIVRGHAHLLEDVAALADLERVRAMLEALETRRHMLRLLDMVHTADGVQIFIGAQNDLFKMSGCSMIVAPFQNSREQIVGAIGVIGPTRINYARIIPLVDYTAKVISRLVG